MSKQRGFSIIELMIAVAIVAILASIALPSYNDYLIRSRFPEGQAAIAAARIRAEQFFQDNQTYIGMPCPAASSTFTYACAATATTYTITATGNSQVAGFGFTINENADRTSVAPADWMPAVNNCWITRKKTCS